MTDEEMSALNEEITEHAAVLEKKIGVLFAEYFELARAKDIDAKVLVGALHMSMCCSLAKVYSMASTGGDEARAGFVRSVAAGVEHFIAVTEQAKPMLMVEALLQSMRAAMEKKKEQP